MNIYALIICLWGSYCGTVQVSASTAIGEGPLSLPVFSLTDEDTPDGAVQNLNAVPLSSSSITVTWDPPVLTLQDGVILGYQINVTR